MMELDVHETNTLLFILNGKLVEVDNPDPQQLLVHYLRQSGYTGTKFVCGEGGCGACTVNIRPWKTPGAKYIAVYGCLRPLAAVHEMEVLTVEGLGSFTAQPPHWSEVQYKIAQYNGSQCGYCTPGFVMGMNAFLEKIPEEQRSIVDIENIFDGHLCRCTGYRPILCGMKTFAKCGNREELKETPPLIIDRDMENSLQTTHPNIAIEEVEAQLFSLSNGGTAEPILVSKKDDYTWYGLKTLEQLWFYLQKFRNQRESVRIVAANTAIGIQVYQKFIKRQNTMLFVGRIPELTVLKKDSNFITAGCAVPIQELRDEMESLSKAYAGKDKRSSYPPSVAFNHWRRLATTEIRNVGSIAGNLYLAKVQGFASDLFIVLATLGATVTVASSDTSKVEYSMMDFLQKDGNLDGTNIIYEVKIPYQAKQDVFMDSYKVSQRAQNSHPMVNAGFSMKVSTAKFEEVKIFFGNIADKGLQEMTTTEKWMVANCTPENLHDKLPMLFTALQHELSEIVSANPKYSTAFRVNTACNAFFKYLVKMAAAFQFSHWNDIKNLYKAPDSLVNQRFTAPSSGQQDFCVYTDEYPVSEPIIKQSAFLQASGEAKYTQDFGRLSHHLHGVYILNLGAKAQAYADFEVSNSAIVTLKKKFHDIQVFTADDVGAASNYKRDEKTHLYTRNSMGQGQAGFPGDTIFAEKEVSYIGQPIGMVVAKTQETARYAAEWLQENAITYTSKPGSQPPIINLSDAISKGNFFNDNSVDKNAPSRLLKISRPTSLTEINWTKYDNDPSVVVVEGTQDANSQYHFYMESQASFAFPTEQGGMKVHASTQSPDETQVAVARACNLQMNQVTLETLRLGGGYGGKSVQSKFTACAAAFCAQQLKQPVRVANYHVEDMHMIGKKHGFTGKYKLAATKDGTLKAIELRLFNDGGCTYDCTFSVMDVAVFASDNAYNSPEFLVMGKCARTNKASNTAFRSFGVIPTMTIVEASMEALAEKLNIPADVLREKNFYKTGEATPYGQTLLQCNLQVVWDAVKSSSNYEARKEDVKAYNKSSIFKKRGIKLLPLKFGISYTYKPNNKGSAIVSVFAQDGTVLLTHGGVEMGQGINTKIMQIAALELNIPMCIIRTHENSTDKIANAVSTTASTGFDLNGGAVKDACMKLRQSLITNLKEAAPKDSEALQYFEEHGVWYTPGPNGKNYWKEVIDLARNKRIPLISHGHFEYPDLIEVTNDHPTGKPFYYFNYAAAVSEVEVDALTGEFTILRSDIVYDAGHSLNPAIDIGQIEGAFVMGIGTVTTEELDYDENGRLLTDGTWEYKPPCSKTIPEDLRVTLYPGTKHKQYKHPEHRLCHRTGNLHNPVRIDPCGIQSSKTTSEPPLVLANSVFFAIRQAVAEARKEVGLTGDFQFASPATVQRIQQTCGFTPERVAGLVKSF